MGVKTIGAREPLSTGLDETGVKEAFGPAETSTGPGLAPKISSRVGSEAFLSVEACIPKLFSKMRLPGKVLNHTKGKRLPEVEPSFPVNFSDELSDELLDSLLEGELELALSLPVMGISAVPLSNGGSTSPSNLATLCTEFLWSVPGRTGGERLSAAAESPFPGLFSEELSELLDSLLEVELELLALVPTLLAMEVSAVPLDTLETGVSALSRNSAETYFRKRFLSKLYRDLYRAYQNLPMGKRQLLHLHPQGRFRISF